MRNTHPFGPLYNRESKILILGSFPSVKSREQLFFYGHPQNRFWKMMAALLNEEVPASIEEKSRMLLKHHIALWDSIASCEITGSSDASIKGVIPNDIGKILKETGITHIYCNGTASYRIYEKYVYPQTGIHAVVLPSTSAANAACSFEKLIDAWKIIRNNL